MAERPAISVIIPVWNGERYLRSTMDALAAQTAPGDRYEIIVVDNGSTDSSVTILRDYPEITVLSEPRPGSYRARNHAVGSASGEYLLFTDADCRPHPDWIEKALAIADADKVAGVTGGRITLYREGPGNHSAALFEELTSFNQAQYIAAKRCVTANWLCRKSVLLEVGGFDAEMLSGGDFDCARKVIEAGYEIRYAPEMTVEHPVRAEVAGLIAKRRRVVGGMWTKDGLKDQSAPHALFGLVKAGARQMGTIMRSDIPGGSKPGVLAISALITAASLFETIRLKSGASPYRS
ncbi:glycosyltransferase family A protein [Altererythrobacter sp. ZODW24]|uniref:glycosyltransferase n=1 Tax=Altererythrobacter sp. ZODW24 TaxID=2185142 RepID=UPI0013B4258D|nr:glycosyltransferase family A protein [Altererythrobacter sp. ZODW24]